VSDKLLAAAQHEADLLGHPYVGLKHLELGRLTLAGRAVERDDLRRDTADPGSGLGRRQRSRYGPSVGRLRATTPGGR